MTGLVMIVNRRLGHLVFFYSFMKVSNITRPVTGQPRKSGH